MHSTSLLNSFTHPFHDDDEDGGGGDNDGAWDGEAHEQQVRRVARVGRVVPRGAAAVGKT